MILLSWVAWMAVVLAACGTTTGLTPTLTPTLNAGILPSPTPGPSPTPANCLVGVWEIKDKEAYLRASIPAGAFESSELKYIGTIGSVGMRFDNDGTIAVQVENFMGRFDVTHGAEVDLLDVQINGYASGTYQLDGDQLKITGMKRSEMKYLATYGQTTMMSETQADRFLPLFVEPYSTATVDCTAQTLSIDILNLPNLQGPLEFERLR